ncbi:MAG: MFS transporter [Patescibacteria group bacterium]
MKKTKNVLWKFLPFWIFLVFFKLSGGLHYSLISPLGERLMPLWLVGLLMGGGSLIQLVLDVPAGFLLDRFGYRRLLKLTTFIFLFAAVSYMFGLTEVTFLISLLMSTFGWLFFGPGVSAYILSHADKKNSGRMISMRDIFGSLGVVCSSALLPFVILLAPLQIGWIIFIPLLLALLSLVFSPKDVNSVHAEIKHPSHHHFIRRNYLPTLLATISTLNPASGMLLLTNLTGSIFYSVIWFVVPLVIAHQINAGMLGIGLGIFDFAIVVLGFMLGNLADKFNKRLLVFCGLLLFSVSGMLLGFNFGWLFLLLGFVATTGDEMSEISLWSWLHALDKNHANDGKISGVIYLFQDLGWAIGPIAAGLLYGFVGSTWTIVIGATPIFLTWIVYLFLVRHQPGKVLSLSQIPIKPHRARHKN